MVKDVNYLSDVGSLTLKLTSELDKLYCKYFPNKVKYVTLRQLNTPWISSGILKSIKTKSQYFKLFKLGVINSEQNRRYRNCLNSLIRQAKRQYYINTFHSCQDNIKKTWTLIKQLIGKKSKTTATKTLTINNTDVTDNVEVAEQFNSYFASIAHILDSDIPLSNQSPYHYVEENQSTSLFFRPTTVSEIESVLQNLKNSSVRIDEMPVHLYKRLKNILSEPFATLLNKSIGAGIFPECLKCARVVPVFKKGDPKDVSNYRPISVLPTLSKIFERCISVRITDFLNRFNILFCRQFGFRKGKSTIDAFVSLTEHIYNCLNQKEHCIGIFIDLKKAFDTVNHTILLGKLERYGIRGLPLQWIASYLSDRRQYVTINGQCSAPKNVNVGVPQGSIIGPLLFLLYINDLPNVSSSLWSILYADDTSFLAGNHDFADLIENINSELPKLHEWTLASGLSLSLDKTYTMLFTNREFVMEDMNNIYINNVAIEWKSYENFLGLMVDEKLKFKNHIQYVCNKVSKTVGILYKIKHYVPRKILLNLYYSLAYPYFLYANLLWGGTDQVHLTPLVTLQKKLIRIINDANYLAHTTPLFKKSGILKLKDLNEFILAQYIFKRKLDNDTMFESAHNYDTRFRENAQPAFHRLSQTQHSVSFVGPHIWNSIPLYIRRSDTLSTFKIELKKYYISKYND